MFENVLVYPMDLIKIKNILLFYRLFGNVLERKCKFSFRRIEIKLIVNQSIWDQSHPMPDQLTQLRINFSLPIWEIFFQNNFFEAWSSPSLGELHASEKNINIQGKGLRNYRNLSRHPGEKCERRQHRPGWSFHTSARGLCEGQSDWGLPCFVKMGPIKMALRRYAPHVKTNRRLFKMGPRETRVCNHHLRRCK